MAIKQGKLVTITSVKGGVGKTFTTINMAGIYAKRDLQVLIIDSDLYGNGIGTYLDIDSNKDIYKLINDLNNNQFSNLENYVEKYNKHIDVLKAPKDPRLANKINSKYLEIIYNKAKLKYDVILVDTSHVIDSTNLITFDTSDEIIYILSNDPLDLKNMKSMVSIYKDMEKTNYKIVLNNAKDKNRLFFEKFDIKNIVKTNVDYIIPSEFYIRKFDKMIIDSEIITLDQNFSKKYKKTNKIFNLIADFTLDKKE